MDRIKQALRRKAEENAAKKLAERRELYEKAQKWDRAEVVARADIDGGVRERISSHDFVRQARGWGFGLCDCVVNNLDAEVKYSLLIPSE